MVSIGAGCRVVVLVSVTQWSTKARTGPFGCTRSRRYGRSCRASARGHTAGENVRPHPPTPITIFVDLVNRNTLIVPMQYCRGGGDGATDAQRSLPISEPRQTKTKTKNTLCICYLTTRDYHHDSSSSRNGVPKS